MIHDIIHLNMKINYTMKRHELRYLNFLSIDIAELKIDFGFIRLICLLDFFADTLLASPAPLPPLLLFCSFSPMIWKPTCQLLIPVSYHPHPNTSLRSPPEWKKKKMHGCTPKMIGLDKDWIGETWEASKHGYITNKNWWN